MRPGEIWLQKGGGSDRMTPRSGGAGSASAFPCLNTNNSIQTLEKEDEKDTLQNLTSGHRKTAFALEKNIQRLAAKYGIERIALWTPTHLKPLFCAKKAGKRFNSLNSNILTQRYEEMITVMERMKSGAIHYHILVVLPVDIRTGFDFEKVKVRDYRSANKHLRAEWAFWRKNGPKYGFGRCEMLPIKSTAEAISKYVGKYIAKHIGCRAPEDKGVRLVRYSAGASFTSTRFQFASVRSALWRHQVGLYAAKHGCVDLGALQTKFGPQVLYRKREEIRAIEPTRHDHWELWNFDRAAVAFRVAKALGITQGEAFVGLFQRGTVWGRSVDLVVDAPRYSPPPRVKQVDACAVVERTTIFADGRVTRVLVREGAGVKVTPESAEREDIAGETHREPMRESGVEAVGRDKLDPLISQKLLTFEALEPPSG